MRDRGVSGSLAWDPRPGSERGLKLTVSHAMGAPASGGMDALYARPTMAGLVANEDGDELSRRRFEARLGYGLAVFSGRFTATPEARARALERAARDERRLAPRPRQDRPRLARAPPRRHPSRGGRRRRARARSCPQASTPAGECQENSVMDSRWKSGGRKGVTNRLRREPCARHREVPCEVSVAVRVGKAIERRNALFGVPRLYQRPKATPSDRYREGARAPRRPRTQARTYVHAGDLRGLQSAPGVVPGPRKRGEGPNR